MKNSPASFHRFRISSKMRGSNVALLVIIMVVIWWSMAAIDIHTNVARIQAIVAEQAVKEDELMQIQHIPTRELVSKRDFLNRKGNSSKRKDKGTEKEEGEGPLPPNPHWKEHEEDPEELKREWETVEDEKVLEDDESSSFHKSFRNKKLAHDPDFSVPYQSTLPRAPICSSPPLVVMGIHVLSLKGKSAVQWDQTIRPPKSDHEAETSADYPFLVQRNALVALSALRPLVKTVVFASSEALEDWREFVVGLGMVITDDFELNPFGAPYFRSIMTYLEGNIIAPFYGFADADIIFSSTIITTIKYLNQAVCNFEISPKIMITGRRIPIDPVAVPKLDRIGFKHRGNSSDFDPKEALSYVIMIRGLFDWDDINNFPDYVVGRLKLYGALINMARKSGTTIFEGSRGVVVYHQSGREVLFSGSQKGNKPDILWNQFLRNPMQFEEEELYKYGHSYSAHYFLVLQSKNITVGRTSVPLPIDLFPPQKGLEEKS